MPMTGECYAATELSRELTGGQCVIRGEVPLRTFSMETIHVARNHSPHHLDTAPHRRAAHLALQRRLGLLSLRRARPRGRHHSHPLAAGTAVDVGVTQPHRYRP